MFTCPAITSVIAGGTPRYGTCVIFVPAIELNSAPDRCVDVPLPDDE